MSLIHQNGASCSFQWSHWVWFYLKSKAFVSLQRIHLYDSSLIYAAAKVFINCIHRGSGSLQNVFCMGATGGFLHFQLYLQVFIIEGHSFQEKYKIKSGVVEFGYSETIQKHANRVSVVINGGGQEQCRPGQVRRTQSLTNVLNERRLCAHRKNANSETFTTGGEALRTAQVL